MGTDTPGTPAPLNYLGEIDEALEQLALRLESTEFFLRGKASELRVTIRSSLREGGLTEEVLSRFIEAGVRAGYSVESQLDRMVNYLYDTVLCPTNPAT